MNDDMEVTIYHVHRHHCGSEECAPRLNAFLFNAVVDGI